jgi:hypothetical protein
MQRKHADAAYSQGFTVERSLNAIRTKLRENEEAFHCGIVAAGSSLPISHALVPCGNWPRVCSKSEGEIPNTFATHKPKILEVRTL